MCSKCQVKWLGMNTSKSFTMKQKCGRYHLGTLCPRPMSPACSLWSASHWNSWPAPQCHAATGNAGQSGLEFACVFLPWHKELDLSRELGSSGPPWKERKICWNLNPVYWVQASKADEVAVTDQSFSCEPGSPQKGKFYLLPEPVERELQEIHCKTNNNSSESILMWFLKLYYHFFSRWDPKAL